MTQEAKKKILLVDDSNIAILVEKTMLPAETFEVRIAKDGAEGLQRAREFLPDLVLMDVNMPAMDGIEATRRLRQDPRTQHIPVILVTTRGREEDTLRGRDAGCTDYVTKPIDVVDLRKKIRAILGQ